MPDIIITPSSGLIDFFPVSTRVGRIEGSGNTINVLNPSGYVAVSGSGLSINTSAPNALLHAYSSISGATILNLEGTNGSLFSVVDNLSGSLMSVNNNAGLPVFEVFSDDRVVAGRFGQNDFIITSGGNVGIGTGVPSSKFHVLGTSTFNGDISSTGSIIAGSGSAANPSFEFISDVDTGMFSPAANTIALSTSGVERVRIDNIGNVGIGNSPQNGFKLDVQGASVLRGQMNIGGGIVGQSTDFAAIRYNLNSAANSNSYSYVCNGGGNFGVGFPSPSGRVAISGGVSIGSNYNLTPPTNGLIVEGTVGIGTTTPTSTLQVSGLVTANSGNFTNSLSVNGTGVWHSGNFDSSNIVRTIGTQTISGVKTFADGLKVVGNAASSQIELGVSQDAIVLFGKTSYDLGINSVSDSYNDGGTNYINTRELLIGKGAISPGTNEQLLFAGNSGIGVVHYYDNGGGVSSNRLIFDVPQATTLASANTTLRTTTADGTNIVLNLPSTSGTLALLANINTTQITGVLSVSKGGTNTSTYSNGQLLIGSGTSLAANTLSAGTGITITNGSGAITIATTGLANYDTSVFNLGTVSGTNAINCGQDRQIQNLTLNGVATTFTTGTGWPSSSSVARETTLNIFASGNTSVTWTIVNDWYRQPDSPLPSGRHIVLLRSVGSGTMQGHYIGNKTN